MSFVRSTLAARLLGAASLVTFGALLAGCPAGHCFVRFKKVDASGKVTSDQCILDSCPKNATYSDAKKGCDCEAGFVTLGGACVTEADAKASCGTGYTFANGACVALSCPAGQILNAQTGACQSKQEADRQVAQNAGVTLGEGQAVGCPAGYTYVVNGAEGACVPNELTCGQGTTYQNGACVAVACAAGQVFDATTNQCVKLAQGDDKVFSVQAKLKAALGPDFCAPHAKNPAGFNVKPGQTQTIKIAVAVNVPGQNIEQAQLASLRVTNVGGAELTAQLYPGVARIQKQVNEQTVPGIRALGGKSVEAQAQAEVTCVIKRAPIQVIETQGGGV